MKAVSTVGVNGAMLLILGPLAGLLGCHSGDGDDVPEPTVYALDRYQISVGSPIEITGDFPECNAEAHYEVGFKGTYTTDDGRELPVDITEPVRCKNQSALVFERFGPYVNPFDPSEGAAGTFAGDLIINVETPSGSNSKTGLRGVRLAVGQSVTVLDIDPSTSDCASGPVEVAVAASCYKFRLRASRNINNCTVRFSAPGTELQPYAVRAAAAGRDCLIGENGEFCMPPIPQNRLSYDAVINIEAVDADTGATLRNAFALPVHLPVTLQKVEMEVQQIFPAERLSGAIPGTEVSSNFTYSIQNAVQRTRSEQVSFSNSVQNAIQLGQNNQRSRDRRQAQGTDLQQKTADTLSYGGKGDFNLFSLIQAGVNLGKSQNKETSDTNKREVAVSEGRATTDTQSNTNTLSDQTAEQYSRSVSSTDTTGKSVTGVIVPGAYGVVYQQETAVLWRLKLAQRTLCGGQEEGGEIAVRDYLFAAQVVQRPTVEEALTNPYGKNYFPAPHCYFGTCVTR